MRRLHIQYLSRVFTYTCLVLGALCITSCNDDDFKEFDGDVKRFTVADGLPDNFITALHEDQFGRIWIGTQSGVAMYDGSSFTVYTEDDGILDNFIETISSDVDGDIWLGNSLGVNVFVENTWYYSTYFYGIHVTTIERDHNNNLWMGSYGQGIFKLDWELQEYFNGYDGMCADCNYVRSLHVDEDNNLWIGTEADVKKVTGANVEDIKTGLPGSIISSITSDGWGNVWIGSQDGTTLSKYRNGSLETVNIGNEATQNWIYGMAEDGNGNVWFSTVGNGLLKYDGAIFRRVKGSLPGETFTAMIKDKYGNLWIGTFENGLIYYVTQ